MVKVRAAMRAGGKGYEGLIGVYFNYRLIRDWLMEANSLLKVQDVYH